MCPYGLQSFNSKRILLLQGPVGPFFSRLAEDLKGVGATVYKVNFHAGDVFFYPKGALAFKQPMGEWIPYFERLITELDIDTVLLFGDCRPLHAQAKAIAHARGLDVGVFEEGYLRPRHITLERSGVNGHSSLPRSPLVYLNQPEWPDVAEQEVGSTFWYMVWWGFWYFTVGALGKLWFPHYRHHRKLTVIEAFPWLRSIWRKQWYRWRERHALNTLLTQADGRYFLVPLQVHNDSQIATHSEFTDVPAFIDCVVRSFAEHAPSNTMLVIKHHPMDRGYTNYRRQITDLARKLGIENRCKYLHDQHLPTMLDHARGVIVINSTVGLQALRHGKPTLVMGKAIYDMQGLCFQGELADFWDAAAEATPDKDLLRRFVKHLKNVNQINGSFYRSIPLAQGKAGLVWPARQMLPNRGTPVADEVDATSRAQASG